jgi:hypothetical protein
MIVRNLYIACISGAPYEADAILIVDTNAVLTHTISAKSFQSVSRRHSQVVQIQGCIENSQFLEGSPP